MPWDAIERLSGVLPRLTSVNLQCNCEPLVNEDLPDFVGFIKQANPGIRVSMVTNGTLLNPAISSRIIANGLDTLIVSLDGATAHTYEKVRVGAKFDTVVSNVKTLVKERNAGENMSPRIEVVAVSSKENAFELPHIMALAKDLGADCFHVMGLEPYTAQMAESVLYGDSAHASYKDVFRHLKKYAQQNRISVQLPSLRLRPHRSCDLRGCVIDSDGHVYPCPSLSYERPFYFLGQRNLHPRICFGNVVEQDFYDIWNGKEFQSFRKRLLRGDLPDYCTNCLIQHRVICPI
jgi:radical SAM protein with 4Fe4S-binding SPASM domain